MKFKKLGLKKELLKAVKELGFQTPMPIQEKAIPVLLSGERDFVGLAQTGTGKTAAFGLPLIQSMVTALPWPQGIVICPTRELCIQITSDLKKYARHMKDIHIVAVYGGASISDQINQLKKGAQIIVATPGRLKDLINRKAVRLSEITHTILDEADEMLNMGFQEDIDSILEKIPEDRRVWLFSATMPKGVVSIARNYLIDPVEVTEGGKIGSPENIEHRYYIIHEKNRYHGLKRIIDYTPDIFGLVFCRTRRETQTIAESLMQDGYQAEALHGDLSQAQRDYVMRKFRQQNIRILVATDVAARGLDVDDITHVIHYRLPDEAEIYTHRSGRTARAGKSGASIARINIKETRRIKEIERKRNIRFEIGKIPNGRAICKKQLFGLVEKIVQTDVNQEEIADYLPAVYEALGEFDKDELIKRFVSAEFNRFLEYYRDTGDINVKATPGKKSKKVKDIYGKATPGKKYKKVSDFKPVKRENRLKGKKTQRFFISVGRLDKINEGAIVRLVCDHTGIRSSKIGEIDLNRELSFFEVDKRSARKIRKSFNNAKFDGRPVQVHKVIKKKKEGKGQSAGRKAQSA
ncbi:MAG: DEAD/DEAH box helicase [Deltaproteobacteria bacterium]|nr:DEAD/DEAH box helicase [Deltaproteobacteria bacterium]